MNDYQQQQFSMASWIPEDAAGIMRQQSTVHTQVESYQPPPAPVYATPTRGRFATSTGAGARVLVQDASLRIRVAVANLVLVLAGIAASVFLIALVILGIRLWGWLA